MSARPTASRRSVLNKLHLLSRAALIDSTDDELLHSILYNPHHVLHSTVPKETGSSYGLRRRRHNRELLDKSSRLVQTCFLVQLLYKDIYWLLRPISTNHLSFYIHIIDTLYTLHFVKVLLKFYLLIDWAACQERSERRCVFVIELQLKSKSDSSK